VTDFLTELRSELLDGLERYERAPWWRRPPRTRPAARRIAAATLAVAAVVAAVVLVASRPADLERSTTPLVSRLEGFHAGGLAERDGSLWASEPNSDSLLRIDLRTGRIARRIDVGGSPGTVIAAAGAVWTIDWEHGRLVKVDPRTARVTKALALSHGGSDIAFADGSLWTAGRDGRLLRINPKTTSVSSGVPLGIKVGADSPGMTAAGDRLWVTVGSAIVEVDARTERVVGRAHGPFLPLEFGRRAIATDDALWITSPTRREVVRVDARTLQLTRHRVGGDPGTAGLVNGRVSVGTVHDSEPLTRLTVLDAAGRVTRTVAIPHPAAAIVPSPRGGAWVTFGEDQNLSPAAIHVP
jgi:streptogramin lyase